MRRRKKPWGEIPPDPEGEAARPSQGCAEKGSPAGHALVLVVLLSFMALRGLSSFGRGRRDAEAGGEARGEMRG